MAASSGGLCNADTNFLFIFILINRMNEALTNHQPHQHCAGTQHGAQLMLEHAGVAHSNNGVVVRGHHYFNVLIVVPMSNQLPSAAQGVITQLQKLQKQRKGQPSRAGDQRPNYSETFDIP